MSARPNKSRCRRYPRLTLGGAVSLLALLAGCDSATPQHATVLPEPASLPEFTLEDGDGQAFTKASFENRVSLVFFGFTHCPDVCPLTLSQLAAARRMLAEAGEIRLPEVVFVSVDPARDSAERVAEYAAAFGDGVTGVRGSLEALEALTAALGIFHARPETGDGYDVEHSGAVIVIDERARFHAVFSAPHEASEFVDDWPRLLRYIGDVS